MKKIIGVGFLSLTLFSFGVLVYAQEKTGSGGQYTQTVALQNPLGSEYNDIGALVTKVVNFLARFLLAIAAFFIIYSGFKFVSASGNPEKLKEAKDSLKNALIGTALILIASTVGKVIQNLIESLQKNT